MLTLQIWNVSDLAPVSDYKYAVYINREQIATGTVTGHTREDGWAILVKKLAEAHIAVTTIERDGRVIGTQQATVQAFQACGKVDAKGKVCVGPVGPGHKCKFMKIVAEPARPKRLKR